MDLSETLERSSFKQARQGMRINLERALMLNDRLGGHFVLGHVDGVGQLAAKIPRAEGAEMSFEYPPALERYLVYKGSIAVNGISLTISSLGKGSFSVAVIPHTLDWTNLNGLRIGDLVNLEVDILGKYFERFFYLGLLASEKKDSKLTAE
jgi:riboflavin synthase